MKLFRDICLLIIVLVSFTITGCTVMTRDISPDEKIHYDEGYDFSDKKVIVENLLHSLLYKSPLGTGSDRPVLIVYGIANRTSEHISTSGITDDIRQGIVESGKARMINKAQRDNIRRETEYQYAGAVARETRIKQGRQLGAKYMITGTLRSIEKEQPKQARLWKKTLMYYSLNLELTDLETSIIEWADRVEVVRESSKPFIGW